MKKKNSFKKGNKGFFLSNPVVLNWADFTPRGYLAMSGDISSCHNCGMLLEFSG